MPLMLSQDTAQFRTYNNKVTTNLEFLKFGLSRLDHGYPLFIVLCGSQRGGKSFLGIWLYKVFKIYFNRQYDHPENDTLYDPALITRRIENEIRGVYILDEASDIINNQEWWSKTHQAIKMIVNTQTYKRFVIIVISPFVVDLNKSIRRHFDIKINARNKGDYIAYKYKKKYDAEKAEQANRALFVTHFGLSKNALEPEVWNRYEEFAFEQKNNLLKKRARSISKIGKKIEMNKIITQLKELSREEENGF